MSGTVVIMGSEAVW